MDWENWNISAEQVNTWLFTYGLQVVGAALILVVGWIAAKIVRKCAARLMERVSMEPILVNFLSNILYALVLAFVVIAALNKLGIQTASLIAVLGAAGLAIGLALQGSLSNFAAGVMIILFRYFKLGDFIQGAGVMGTVEDMNIFMTTLQTPTNEKIMVPNASLTTGALTNFTANDTRRIDHIIGIGYEDDIASAKDIIGKIIESDNRILKDPEPFIGVDALADNSVNLAVRVWVQKADFLQVKCGLLERIKHEFSTSGISIPFPQRTVHVIQPK